MKMTVLQMFRMLRDVDFGLIIIPANMKGLLLKASIKAKAALLLHAQGSFMNTTAEQKDFLITTI